MRRGIRRNLQEHGGSDDASAGRCVPFQRVRLSGAAGAWCPKSATNACSAKSTSCRPVVMTDAVSQGLAREQTPNDFQGLLSGIYSDLLADGARPRNSHCTCSCRRRLGLSMGRSFGLRRRKHPTRARHTARPTGHPRSPGDIRSRIRPARLAVDAPLRVGGQWSLVVRPGNAAANPPLLQSADTARGLRLRGDPRHTVAEVQFRLTVFAEANGR